MERIYNMSDGTLMRINMENYSEEEFLVTEVDFLGCNPNSHKIAIAEEVFRQCASTVLGKFLVAKVAYGDATGHASDEAIVGYIPPEQEVRFVRNNQGYLRGIVDGVVSKQYAPEFCKIFTQANHTRSVSVEMGVEEEPNDDGTIAKRFNIMGVTVLGMAVRPSSPGSTIDVKRFSETTIKNDCDNYYKSVWQRLAEKEDSELDVYVQNRKTKFAKSYSVNTTELKETPWGEVDKTELRNKVMEASNRAELVHKVYLKVMDGWEEAPSENLKYPVMEFKDGTFYYNRFALASALAYARQHDEADVVSKVEKLYKKFKLAEEGEDKSMSKEFEEKDERCPECGKPMDECECSEDEKKPEEAEKECSEDKTEECAEEKQEECAEEAEGEKSEECAECSEDKDENSEEDEADNKDDDDSEDNDDSDEDKAECSEDEEMSDKDKKISELEDIIMEKDKEIAELREYKDAKEKAEKEFAVQELLEELRECVDDETLESLKEEGLACSLSEIDGWKNKAKAMAFDKGARKEMSTGIWSMAIATTVKKESTSKWDSI